MIDEFYMKRCLSLAKKGIGYTSPNPLVGCVIVYNNKIIGEGYHQKYGGNHAEKNAIENCIEDPLGATAFVTLEPCCIHSKTPPCTQLLIDNGIDEVFIASKDPNPDIDGKGIQQLKDSGIHVYQGFLDSDVSKLNKGFFKWVKYGLPWVTVKIAQNQDGFMGLDNETQTWITNEQSKANVHYLRSKTDAILVGTQTARIDNPQLTVRKVPGCNPKRIVVDRNRTLPLDLNLYSDNQAETLVMCSDKLFDKNIVIALGDVETKRYDDVFYAPVYLIVTEGEYYKIGIYEFLAKDYFNLLDEENDIDISIIEGPLLFDVVNKDNLEEYLTGLRKEQNTEEYVFYAITPKTYELLALNMQEIKRFILQQKEIIILTCMDR